MRYGNQKKIMIYDFFCIFGAMFSGILLFIGKDVFINRLKK